MLFLDAVRNPNTLSWRAILLAVAMTTAASAAIAADGAPRVGQAAPEFTGTDTGGKTMDLRQLRGQVVVLEWSNHECPFVGKQYRSGNMQTLQKEATGHGVVWLTVLSSAPGTQGNVTAAQANELTQQRGAAPTAVILDPDGTIGRAYGARTTPHMFVIDKTGMLVYMGAIDDRPTTDVADVPGARNYVRLALAAIADGKPVQDPITKPYGCSVKYR